MRIVHLDQEDILHDGNISVCMNLNKYCLMKHAKYVFADLLCISLQMCAKNMQTLHKSEKD